MILVDEISQSQAEYTTMAFRAGPHAIVVGSTTSGNDGNVCPIALPGGVRSMISESACSIQTSDRPSALAFFLTWK